MERMKRVSLRWWRPSLDLAAYTVLPVLIYFEAWLDKVKDQWEDGTITSWQLTKLGVATSILALNAVKAYLNKSWHEASEKPGA